MTVSLLVAAAENNVIGKNNQLPWHLPADLKYFKNTTWAMPIVMGRKTFESMGKALPGRKNIVISRKAGAEFPGAITATSLEEAVRLAGQGGAKEVFVTGGGEIFKTAITIADRIYITRVHATVDGDVYFPEFSLNDWRLSQQTDMKADEKNNFDMSFQIFERKK